MSVTTQLQERRFKLTVSDGFLRFREGDIYEEEMTRLDTLKSVQISPDSSTKKIYASGKVYDVTVNVRGAKLSVDSIALPTDIVQKAHGAVVEGALSYETSLPTTKEFGFGFVTKHSDGNDIYVWYPRCKLNFTNEDNQTSDDSDLDPKESYEIEAMPTDEGVWRVKYDTKSASGTPMTAEAFFGEGMYAIADMTV